MYQDVYVKIQKTVKQNKIGSNERNAVSYSKQNLMQKQSLNQEKLVGENYSVALG